MIGHRWIIFFRIYTNNPQLIPGLRDEIIHIIDEMSLKN